ncbi:EAL domain-containing protein [Fervidibacillus halotolerans]|uniref:EAL domain-containing protein n=1 Tax=Fervidibacillus halotolerans TaxID=2980027 RepID=A0A9E8M2P0_9BACI|nr:EAL domain-containing protein [Fervidibacillus halotolerans]WAA13970.1 EAL domain-containing protein [Fervidibacillus halotolerans]
MNHQDLRNGFQKGIYFHHYQPIVNLGTNEVFGFESLLRSNSVQNPLFLFQIAKNLNKLNEIDLLSMEWSLKGLQKSNKIHGKHLFLNVFPSTINLPSFSHFIHEISSQNPNNWKIVLEISELEKIVDFPLFKRTIAELQQINIAIAIDDVGSGSSPFRKFVELEPDYVKLDRYFAKDLHLSPKKQQLIQLLLQYFGNSKTKFILEGIEKPGELSVAKKIGIQYGQGFLLGKPTKLADCSK